MHFSLQEAVDITEAGLVPDDAGGSFSRLLTDTREDCADGLFIAIAGEVYDAHDFLDKAVDANAAALCIDRVKSSKLPANIKIPVLLVDDTVTAYQMLAREHKRRQENLKTIAVTGSMGKTSTKEIIRAILNAAFGNEAVLATAGNLNNQIGVPKTLSGLESGHRTAVIEAGTNHHGELKPLSKAIEPDVAVISSIGPCHLEFLGDLNGVAREKSAIFTYLKLDGTAIFPKDAPGIDIITSNADKFNVVTFGDSRDADVRGEYLGGNLNGSHIRLTLKDGTVIETDWPLTGKHQTLNAAAAAAAASAIGVPPEAIVEGLRQVVLPGLRMRISEHNGAAWVNDAYNASPGSVTAVLEWLSDFTDPEKCVLVLGDMLELGESEGESHREITALAGKLFPGARIISVGPRYQACMAENILNFPDAAAAVDAVRDMVKAGDTVLLKGSRGMRLEQIDPGY